MSGVFGDCSFNPMRSRCNIITNLTNLIISPGRSSGQKRILRLGAISRRWPRGNEAGSRPEYITRISSLKMRISARHDIAKSNSVQASASSGNESCETGILEREITTKHWLPSYSYKKLREGIIFSLMRYSQF